MKLKKLVTKLLIILLRIITLFIWKGKKSAVPVKIKKRYTPTKKKTAKKNQAQRNQAKRKVQKKKGKK